MAGFLNLKCFCSTKEHCHIKLCMDNSIAVSYLQNVRGGGKIPALHAFAREIWLWCKQRNIWLTACHLPGRDNIEADKLTRNLSKEMEWMVDKKIFQEISANFGTPELSYSHQE